MRNRKTARKNLSAMEKIFCEALKGDPSDLVSLRGLIALVEYRRNPFVIVLTTNEQKVEESK